MAEFNMQFTDYGGFTASFVESQELNAGFGEVQKVSTSNYEELSNKPKINSVEVIGDKSFEEYGLRSMTNLEIKEAFDKVFNKGGN